MDKKYNDKAIRVMQTSIEVWTPQGSVYHVYYDMKDTKIFYIDFCEDTRDVDMLGRFNTLEDAEYAAYKWVQDWLDQLED